MRLFWKNYDKYDKVIFINNPAATGGGALILLSQFLEALKNDSPRDFLYLVFCSSPQLKEYEDNNIKFIDNIQAKKWLARVKWDIWGLKQWSKKNKILADIVISLQNTMPFYFKKAKKILYIQQALPFVKEIKWNFFRQEERSLWFYKNIYPYFIRLNLFQVDYIITQTEWLRKKIITTFKINPDKVLKIYPALKFSQANNISPFSFNDSKYHIFYPAPPTKYKNHQLIIKALEIIKHNHKEIYQNLKIHFTFSYKERGINWLLKLVKKAKIDDILIYEGRLDYKKVWQFYKAVDLLVLPSYIESFQLPLFEGAFLGLPILAADLEVSREIISDYPGIQFLDYNEPQLWAQKIIESYYLKKKFPSFSPQFNSSWKTLIDLIINL